MKSLRTPPASMPSSPRNSALRPNIPRICPCNPGTFCAVMPISKSPNDLSASWVRAARTRSPCRRTAMGTMELSRISRARAALSRVPWGISRSRSSGSRASATCSRTSARACCADASSLRDAERMTSHASRVIFTLRHRDASSTLPKKSPARCLPLASASRPRREPASSAATRSRTAFCSTRGSSPKRRRTSQLQGKISSPQGSRLTMPQETAAR
mmetsp:Transcript_73387/g.215148  ORF Transcript_73387/g.215148 Transcript_73387/m.215148 type:complete len:215 (+) Transcript_73387:1051-1695(+)